MLKDMYLFLKYIQFLFTHLVILYQLLYTNIYVTGGGVVSMTKDDVELLCTVLVLLKLPNIPNSLK